ncbi:CRISPR-associated endoribonuclease Cas6 [Caldicellulosiruptoraceae bacterium PP1]
MRYKLKFLIENDIEMDINYNLSLAEAIKNLVSPKYIEFIDNGAFALNGRIYKPWTFSRLLPDKYLINNSKLIINNGYIELILSSIDENFLFSFLEGILRKKGLSIQNCFLPLNSISVINNKVRNILLCKSISPLIVRDYEIMNIKEIDIINEVTKSIKTNLISKTKVFKKINVNAEQINIDILEQEKIKKKFIKIKTEKYLGFDLKLKIEAPEEVNIIAYNCGIGIKNALGFGCIEHLKISDEKIVYRI